MSIKKSLNALLLTALAMTTMSAGAANVNASDARLIAGNYLKQHSSSAGMLKAPALADLSLAHVEKSMDQADVNDYYAFNITGGGFIIVAGEDRATPVLGYSDKGRIDFSNLPAPLQDLLNGYKAEIEFLRSPEGQDLVAYQDAPTLKATTTVGPLISTTWGQEMPYYLQCPLYQGEYCVVGCVATAMAQVMNYWQYPTTFSSISRYYCYDIGGYVPALPATTVDYSLMLDSYCHWDYDNGVLVQDVYTDAQAQEVAKLGRYCGQAVQMGYSPEGSGAYTYNQANAMKNFGFSNTATLSKSYSASSSWNNTLKAEINAGRPILYSASDPREGGHAFICDGYNSDGYFHFNLGWYGTCDGWYTTSALSMVHREGDQLNFTSSHEIVYKVEPPEYCTIRTDGLNASDELMILGTTIMDAQALNVNLNTSYSNVNMLFAVTDAAGNRVANGDVVTIAKNTFVQGSTVNGQLALPATLEPGTYNLSLYYYITSAGLPTLVMNDGQLVVVGHLAKYNAPFGIADVTTVIDYILNGTYPTLGISDVTTLIDYVLMAK